MKSLTSTRRLIVLLTTFSLAMGFFEATVVVYLRQLYYPEGFSFPLKLMSPQAFVIEYLRELSTLIMLSSVAIIAGKNFPQRFAFFLFSFGVWDIFYYVWLKALLNWPPSLLTWDILFLIPVIWTAPVLAPIISAITMILLAGSMICFEQKGHAANLILREWVFLLSGALIVFCSFIWDYSQILIQGGYFSNLWKLGTNQDILRESAHFIPTHYHWSLFILGEILILCAMGLFCERMVRRRLSDRASINCS